MSALEADDVLVERGEDILRITWNRPHALNALTPAMLRTARAAVEGVSDERLVVLAARGRAFSSGAAIDESIDPDDTLDAASALVRSLVDCPVPVLARLQGPTVGVGVSVALSADLTVVAESAYFLQAFVNIGLIPDGGATELIAAAVGRARATRMVMLGERLSASDAFGAGLVTHLVPDAEFEGACEALETSLRTGPTLAYRAMRRILREATLPTLDRTIEAEAAAQRALFGTPDQVEGVAAFQERRRPIFVGSSRPDAAFAHLQTS